MFEVLGGDGDNGVHNEETEQTETNEDIYCFLKKYIFFFVSSSFSSFLRCESFSFVPSVGGAVMRSLSIVFVALLLAPSSSPTRSPDIPFKTIMIDNGASETAAVADVNKDGRLEIISGENWYEAPRPGSGQAPSWTKHKFRELNFTSN